MTKITPTQIANVLSTSFFGVCVKANVNDMVKALGEPHFTDADNNTSLEWAFETEYGMPFTIYDWQEKVPANVNREQVCEFHIGSNSKKGAERAKDIIEEYLHIPLTSRTMATTNYAERLIEDINNSKKKSIRLNEPVIMYAEIRTDTDHTIDFGVYKIAVERFSVKKNIFGDYKILIANGEHQITSFAKDSYDAIHRQMKK